jgi:hypothetical protein
MTPLELTVLAVRGFLLITSITLKLDPHVRAAGDRRGKP